MKQLILSSLIFFLTFNIAMGQRGSLKGVVVDPSSNENIPYATVALTRTGEQNAFTGAVSDENGRFEIEKIPYGTYQAEVTFIGYNSRQFPGIVVSASNRDIDLGSIELAVSTIGIEQAEVRAAARTAVNKIDRRTYRASDFQTARGGTAIDVLGKLPSVTINSENDISVRGSSDFVVYLNGKPTNTSASVLLGQIPGENIENIDIITVPTSRFEAQGKGGIINITTKRNTSTGLTVLATGMLGGTPWKNDTDVFSNHVMDNNRVNGGLNLNYNFNGLNLHGSINYSNKHNKGIGDIYTYIYQDENQPNSDTWFILDGRGARPKWDQSLYTNIGADYQLGENSEFSANYQYSNRHTGRAAHYKYNTYFSNSIDGAPIAGTLYELFNPNDVHRKGTFQNFNLDYRLNRNDNSSFTATFLYENSNLEQTIENKEFVYMGDQLYYDYYSDEPGDPVFHSFQRDVTPLKAYRFALNYQKEFENGNTIEVGATSQNVRLDGIYEYDTVNINTGQFEGFDYFNNTIDLKRDVYAGYIDYSGTSNKLSYILGLRAEYLDQLMNVTSTRYFEEVYNVFGEIGRDFSETEFKQNKFDLFPSLHLRYKADEQNTISLAASRRINRPPAKDMAPFLYRRHQEIFEMGDPLLEPEYSWNADLSYNRNLGAHNLILTGFVRSASNAIYRVNRLEYDLANTGGVLLRSYTNAGSHLSTGGEAGFNFFFFSRLKLFLGGSLYQFSVESNENLFGDQSSNSSLNWDTKSNLSWEIADPLELTLDYAYKSKSVTPQGEDLPFQMVNIAVNFTPDRLQGWSFYAKMLDIMGTNQSGGYTGATEGTTNLFRRDWVYDYEGQIVEVGASFTFNSRQQQKQLKMIGDEYF
jgi:outer membrane receptor protein involved in Fe transport